MSYKITFRGRSRILKWEGGGPGGGGVLRFSSDGGVPLKPPNLYPSLRVIWRKRVPIIRGVLFKKITFLCTLATKWAKLYLHVVSTVKLQNYTPCLGLFGKTIPHV